MTGLNPSSRRRFLKATVATAAGVVLPGWTLMKGAPAIIASDSERPQALHGVQFGDPSNGSVVVWSRSDRDARMLVEWSYDEQFQQVHRLLGPHALDTTDFTARQDLEGLEPGSEVFGREQLNWLKAGLRNSHAVWKVVAADMPLGLNVGDGATPDGQLIWEAVANGESGPAKGRELEFAELFSYLKRRRIRNVVWLTADVHYCAAHYYNPAKAAFPDFDGFWEFVAGPLNAGTFGPSILDGTFGPEVIFSKAPPAGQANLSPYSGLQFFGEVNIDGQSAELTVHLRDIDGVSVFRKRLQPRIS